MGKRGLKMEISEEGKGNNRESRLCGGAEPMLKQFSVKSCENVNLVSEGGRFFLEVVFKTILNSLLRLLTKVISDVILGTLNVSFF